MYITTLLTYIDLFSKEYALYLRGNKSAGKRARKISLKIEKLLLQFRLESIQQSKLKHKY